jgi:5-oxoprolinase (ATP-hydrolysing) subunit B
VIPPTVRSIGPFGEAALLVGVRDARAAQLLRRALVAAGPSGVTRLVPGRASLLVEYDPLVVTADALADGIRLAADAGDDELPGRMRRIPVVYGGEAGPDLGDVAAALALTPAEAVAAHAEVEHVVLFDGFAPGFAYLGGLPDAWRIPRLPTPRTRVPGGSVAVADGMSGIYPADLPGGWRIIGRTAVTLFDARRDRPAYLEPGDRVRFVPVSAESAATDPTMPDDW